MNYKLSDLKEELTIHKIISIHYFEYMSDFTFPGESHDFWEFLCVDKGEVQVTRDLEKIVLKKSDIIFHKPNEFHAVTANGVIAPNLVVIAFKCQNPGMDFFRDQVLTIGESERNLLAQIITEARSNYSSILDGPYLEELSRRPDAPFGSEQMIKIHLEQLLIQLYRNFFPYHKIQTGISTAMDSDMIYGDIIAYFERNIRTPMTIERICKDNLVSSSQLKKLFRERHGCGVISHYTHMKIEQAKQLIRSRQMNYTQIADYLGYTSVHYFSRQFKKETGMTPSEYTASIKQRTERMILG